MTRKADSRSRTRPSSKKPARPWPVTVVGRLLLLQTAVLLAPLWPQWPLGPEIWGATTLDLLTGLLFCLLALSALLAAVGFLRVSRGAWLSALLVQGLSLLMALILYFRGKPTHIYLMMLYGIFMVLYLHQAEVQTAFRAKPGHADRE